MRGQEKRAQNPDSAAKRANLNGAWTETRRRGRPKGSRDLRGRAARVDMATKASPRWRELAQDFGRLLREQREARGISADELAAAIRVSVMTVFSWERGRVPGVAVLMAISQALGCALADLLPERCYEVG